MDVAIRAPDLLAGFLIECRDELLFLVVIDDDDQVVDWAGEEAVPKSRMVGKFSSGVFQTFLPSKIVGEEAKIGDVDVDASAVGDGGFRTETILAMTAAGRVAGVELALPVDLAGIEIDANRANNAARLR